MHRFTVNTYDNGLDNPCSFYDSVIKKNGEEVSIINFLEAVGNGKWQDIVIPITLINDKEERNKVKTATAPLVTISGTFNDGARTNSGLKKHSGFIAIDLDHLDDVNETKSLICADKYVAAAFVSISGKGLCVLFKIDPAKHLEAFQGIGEYLYTNYNLVVDQKCKNVSRARFVSFDPAIYIAEKAATFKKYPKTKPPKKIEQIIYVKDDFEQVLAQIQSRRLNLCENYDEWLRIGFAFAEQFGEGGRNYFHQVSQYSSKYDLAISDKQYTACLKAKGSNKITISTFYYYCKAAGIQLYSERTKKIAATAISLKRNGISKEDTAKNLEKFAGISGGEDIINQVFDNDIELIKPSHFEIMAKFFSSEGIYKNDITKKCEMEGKTLNEQFLNSVFISLSEKNKHNKGLTKQNYDLFINSENINIKNPVKDYCDSYPASISENENIVKLISSLELKPNDSFDKYAAKELKNPTRDFTVTLMIRWLVGIVASVYDDNYNPLMIVLVGSKNTGKTEFFRRLLPERLKKYFAQSKFNAGKDSEALMCEMLLILNDELDGMNKNDAKTFRNFISQNFYTYRPPYGKQNMAFRRLASVCGTSNEPDIINDPENNRRIVPIEINGIDYKKYNSVDKDMLFSEIYSLYRNHEPWELSSDEIKLFDHFTKGYEASSIEREMIQAVFVPTEPGDQAGTQLLTIEIMKELQTFYPAARLNVGKIGRELTALGFKKRSIRRDDGPIKIYDCRKIIGTVSESGKFF